MKSEDPKLTIVMPIYNVELYMEAALITLLSQSYTDFELIAINDGSTDESGDLLNHYRAADSRIKVVHQDNMGLSAVRNRGLMMAKGEYIWFFDSDDEMAPGGLEQLMERLLETKSEMVAMSVTVIDEDGEVMEREPKWQQPDIYSPVKGSDYFADLVASGHYAPMSQLYIFRREFLFSNRLLAVIG